MGVWSYGQAEKVKTRTFEASLISPEEGPSGPPGRFFERTAGSIRVF